MKNTTHRDPRLIAVSAVALLSVVPVSADTHANPSSTASTLARNCAALATTDFSGILDAPTQVAEAKLMEAKGAAPAYCLATGYVWPNVGIRIGLPATWNGKFMEKGCGGHCGVLPHDEQFPLWCAGLRKGYACIVSDMGHSGGVADALWAYNNLAAKVDWGYRATHVVALAGKALTEHYYQTPPGKSYFIGGSTGGRQGLQEAQRFPWDFDGIVAIAPPVDLSLIYITFVWGSRALHDQDGKPLLGKKDLELLTDAAVAKCDMDDGVKDGIISDPLHCAFDPVELACKAHQTSGCLTRIQIEAVRKVYAGPTNAKGEQLTLGGPVAGSELGQWDKDPRTGWGVSYLGLGVQGAPDGYESLSAAGFRYLFFWPDPGPTWEPSAFDFARDSRRMGLMQTLYDSSNSDLRKFKAAGGKLMVFQGLNDNSVLPRQTIDYYETVERTMGGRKETQSFFRLFLLPGVGHTSGGNGADTIDYLSALEAWVEENKAPDRLIAAHLRDIDEWENWLPFPLDPARIQFTRPVYPYPTRVKYKGHGDPNDSANFSPTDR